MSLRRVVRRPWLKMIHISTVMTRGEKNTRTLYAGPLFSFSVRIFVVIRSTDEATTKSCVWTPVWWMAFPLFINNYHLLLKVGLGFGAQCKTKAWSFSSVSSPQFRHTGQHQDKNSYQTDQLFMNHPAAHCPEISSSPRTPWAWYGPAAGVCWWFCFCWNDHPEPTSAHQSSLSVCRGRKVLNETLSTSRRASWRAPWSWLLDKWILVAVVMATLSSGMQWIVPAPLLCTSTPRHLHPLQSHCSFVSPSRLRWRRSSVNKELTELETQFPHLTGSQPQQSDCLKSMS